MCEQSSLRYFGMKWSRIFANPNNGYSTLLSDEFADACDKFDFKMDNGSAFKERYGRAFYKLDELIRILDDVKDIDLLGSAVYSRWYGNRYYAYNPTDVERTETRNWYTLMLKHIEMLATRSLFDDISDEDEMYSSQTEEEHCERAEAILEGRENPFEGDIDWDELLGLSEEDDDEDEQPGFDF